MTEGQCLRQSSSTSVPARPQGPSANDSGVETLVWGSVTALGQAEERWLQPIDHRGEESQIKSPTQTADCPRNRREVDLLSL
ncbi:MAG TPA: hypothetical protein VKP30_18790, partial [Polyangiaceae bacterium]|nr:hypothetical protein [Polyangiaceae bacterium]